MLPPNYLIPLKSSSEMKHAQILINPLHTVSEQKKLIISRTPVKTKLLDIIRDYCFRNHLISFR